MATAIAASNKPKARSTISLAMPIWRSATAAANMTTTMRAMGHTIKAIEEAGLRDKVKIMVGGAPVDAEFAKRISADGYGSNAPSGVELAKQFAGAKP